jgi:hypothetical protein
LLLPEEILKKHAMETARTYDEVQPQSRDEKKRVDHDHRLDQAFYF